MLKQLSNRPVAILTLFYAAGIFMGAQFAKKYIIIIALALTLILITAGFALKKEPIRVLSFCLAVSSLFLAIGCFHASHTAKNRQAALRSFIQKPCRIYGTVISSPELSESENHYSVTVDVYKIEHRKKATMANGRILLYVSRLDNTAPKMNQCIEFYTTLQSPDYEDGNFNYNEYLRTKNVYATGFTKKVFPCSGFDRPKSLIGKFKELGRNINVFFRERIDFIFDYDNDANALISGILLGEKADFSQKLSNDLSLAGFSHIAAVSGLHLNILFGALCGLLGIFAMKRKRAVFLSLPVILIFAAVTGFTPSVCRAAIMILICIFSILFKRRYDSLTALCLSAFIILAINPYALFSISFILSFASTLSIILLYEPIYSCFRSKAEKYIILRYVFSSVSLSAAAFIGTAPFIAYYFGVVSIASFFANIIVIPLCTPIFVCGYLLCLFSLALPKLILNLLLYPVAFWLKLLIETASLFAYLPFLHFEVPQFHPIFILIYAIAIIFLFMPTEKPQA